MESQIQELYRSALASWDATLHAIAAAGGKAYPPSEDSFKSSLGRLRQQLQDVSSSDTIAEMGERVDAELRDWGERANRYYCEKTGEVKEILKIVADASAQIAERDARYAGQFGKFTEGLENTAKLEDISAIRISLISNVSGLRASLARMTAESQESAAKLSSQVAIYEARLEEVQRLALHDALTGLLNRRGMEDRLNRFAAANRSFSIVYLDLNGLKQVNDTHGHEAGDELLKQFAQELKSATRASDVLARWGGDEFVVLVEGPATNAKMVFERIAKWGNGDYTLHAGSSEAVKISASAAAGIASWEPGDSVAEVMKRADNAMYEQKKGTRRR